MVLATLVAALLALMLPALAVDDYSGPVETEDGMYTETWFLQSFLDLRDDLAEAAASDKRFVIMWELKGCPYCRETHFVNFADSEIRHYIRENFVVLQLNVQGSRLVTDFDGEELEERKLAAKYGIRASPTFHFFPEEADGLADRAPRDRFVEHMPGYFRPPHFMAMFQFIREQAYETEGFRSYLRKKIKKS